MSYTHTLLYNNANDMRSNRELQSCCASRRCAAGRPAACSSQGSGVLQRLHGAAMAGIVQTAAVMSAVCAQQWRVRHAALRHIRPRTKLPGGFFLTTKLRSASCRWNVGLDWPCVNCRSGEQRVDCEHVRVLAHFKCKVGLAMCALQIRSVCIPVLRAFQAMTNNSQNGAFLLVTSTSDVISAQ